jgi:hypothetical protein
MPNRHHEPCPTGAWLRPWVSVHVLVVLVIHAACATGHPTGDRMLSQEREFEAGAAAVYEVQVLEPGTVPTRLVPVDKAAFQRAFQRLAREVQQGGKSPREAARELLKEQMAQQGTNPQLEGEWLAEVSRGRVLSLVPVDESSTLTPQADAALRDQYEKWCRPRGGGDCLGLFDDGPYLRADDRLTLALALAFGSVLDETREALGRELNPRALVAMCVWTVGLYLTSWLVPEPTTKLLAAGLTVILVAWLGVDTLWGLLDGWALLTTRAHEATTFAELREAGEQFARVLGTDAARVMILAVGALTGRTLGKVAARVKLLPGFSVAGMQWEAQGGAAVLAPEVAAETALAQESALVRAVAAVETVVASPHGPLAVVLLKKGRGGGAASGDHSPTTVIRHRGGNSQVVLANGQRWHLPRGTSLQDIPAEDKVGDMLQEAVTRAANEWGPDQLSPKERGAIDKALKEGEYWLARLLEREARGRFVQERVYQQYKHLYEWNRSKGVDVIDPATGRQYEILSGTASNLARHGRRMATELFRMLTF